MNAAKGHYNILERLFNLDKKILSLKVELSKTEQEPENYKMQIQLITSEIDLLEDEEVRLTKLSDELIHEALSSP